MTGMRAAFAVAIMAVLGAANVAEATDTISGNGIADTKHNLSTGGNGPIKATTGTNEICVFCHTPYGGQKDAPLWNRPFTADGSYTPYASPTIDTEAGTIGQPNGISRACLSCHDGLIAFDALRNPPGSSTLGSSVTVTPDAVSTTANNLDWIFTGTTNDKMPNTTVALLGTDLRDDHPISMIYAGGNWDGANAAATDAKFNPLDTASEGGERRRAVVPSTPQPAFGTTITYDNRIYAFRDGPNASAYYVQCTSCHNPHGTKVPSDQTKLYVTFLRKDNTGSELCLTCHIK